METFLIHYYSFVDYPFKNENSFEEWKPFLTFYLSLREPVLFKNENSFEEWKPEIDTVSFFVAVYFLFKNENSFEEWKHL